MKYCCVPAASRPSRLSVVGCSRLLSSIDAMELDKSGHSSKSFIINLASSLGMQTLAEGVETASQLAFLRLQGCNEVLGYYFSKPLTKDEFETFASKH
jgi:EAL domain-containing protein (putative c-di-GMP-specific phosphodiesterase class I)